MNYLQSILRNGVTLTVIAALVVVTLWLVWNQRSTAQPLAQATTEETDDQPVLTPSVQPLSTEATTEAGPSPTVPFIFVTPYYLETPVANPSPTPTFTPTPIPAVKVVSKEPLSLTSIWTANQAEIDIFGWTQEEGLILQTLASSDNKIVWAISPDTGQVKQLSNEEKFTIQSNEGSTAVDELKKINAQINITAISPDKKWVAGGVIDQRTLLVKQG